MLYQVSCLFGNGFEGRLDRVAKWKCFMKERTMPHGIEKTRNKINPFTKIDRPGRNTPTNYLTVDEGQEVYSNVTAFMYKSDRPSRSASCMFASSLCLQRWMTSARTSFMESEKVCHWDRFCKSSHKRSREMLSLICKRMLCRGPEDLDVHLCVFCRCIETKEIQKRVICWRTSCFQSFSDAVQVEWMTSRNGRDTHESFRFQAFLQQTDLRGAISSREARDHERTVQEENDIGCVLLRESSSPQSEKEFPCWLSALSVSMDRNVENTLRFEVLSHSSAQTRMCKSDLETP